MQNVPLRLVGFAFSSLIFHIVLFTAAIIFKMSCCSHIRALCSRTLMAREIFCIAETLYRDPHSHSLLTDSSPPCTEFRMDTLVLRRGTHPVDEQSMVKASPRLPLGISTS